MDSQSISAPQSPGKRERKKVERFQVEVKEKKELQLGTGSGTALADIPVIGWYIDHVNGEHDLLKAIHKVLYGGTGKSSTRKKHLRCFNGFGPGKKKEKVFASIANSKAWKVSCLREFCDFLDLSNDGDKDSLINRLVEFLFEPKRLGRTKVDEVGAPLARSRKRASSGSIRSKAQRSAKKPRKEAKKKKLKKKTASSNKSAPKSQSSPAKDNSASKPKSAKFLFVQSRKNDVIAKHPTLSRVERAKILVEEWKNLPADERKVFEEKAAKELAEYEEALALAREMEEGGLDL